MRKKPKGWISGVELGVLRSRIVPVMLPDDKEERERAIVEIFRASLPYNGIDDFAVTEAVQIEPPGYDFRITMGNGERDLEVTEFAPFRRGEVYRTADAMLNNGETADRLVERVREKSHHYAGYSGPGISLLIYVTHYVYRPSDEVFDLVEYELRTNPSLFERIFFLVPESSGKGYLHCLYPTIGQPLSQSAIEKMRRAWFANGDLSKRPGDD